MQGVMDSAIRRAKKLQRSLAQKPWLSRGLKWG